ncbi:MAG: relaxase/mobilization nuclease domain-containing protein, partial [Blautia sp.]|nr:relaxase/mobilization nuclease domain-containing protein [Blautia sp.]
MAVLKHITSKNADYGAAIEYLLFQHNEITGKPILDENGQMLLREEFYIDGLECDPYSFDMACKQTNAAFGKNQKSEEVKSHHYIISFDPRDRDEHGLSGPKAHALCLEFAKKNFSGHETLVVTHTDGHNNSGNIHTHIVINSVRKKDVEIQEFMERDYDHMAGYKHHQTRALLSYLQNEVMEMCSREGLYQVDLKSPAPKKITNKEYW